MRIGAVSGMQGERQLPKPERVFTGFLVAAVILSGCAADSADGPKVPSAREIARVRIVETEPASVGRYSNLSATVCKDNPLDVPSREAALRLLKIRAYMNGYLALHSVTVGPVEGTLAFSCPGGVQARGVGFAPR
ncbi:MAG: hypothetical protein Kow0026_27150 [Oricola sp.]